jgi:hypothetical protein
VVGTDTSSDGELEVLSLGQALCGQVTGVEAVRGGLARVPSITAKRGAPGGAAG